MQRLGSLQVCYNRSKRPWAPPARPGADDGGAKPMEVDYVGKGGKKGQGKGGQGKGGLGKKGQGKEGKGDAHVLAELAAQ